MKSSWTRRLLTRFTQLNLPGGRKERERRCPAAMRFQDSAFFRFSGMEEKQKAGLSLYMSRRGMIAGTLLFVYNEMEI